MNNKLGILVLLLQRMTGKAGIHAPVGACPENGDFVCYICIQIDKIHEVAAALATTDIPYTIWPACTERPSCVHIPLDRNEVAFLDGYGISIDFNYKDPIISAAVWRS